MLLLTTAGEAHLTALGGGGGITSEFDAIVLGRGNDVPTAGDVFEDITRRIDRATVRDGYPILGDTDPRNGGRGADRWTWSATFEPGQKFVTTNVGVCDEEATGSSPLLASGEEVIEKRSDEALTLFVNAKLGSPPTLFTAHETRSVTAARAVWTPRSRALAISINGLATTSERRVARPGELVRVMALMPDDEGGILSAADVVSGELAVFMRTRAGTWSQVDAVPLPEPVAPTLIRNDLRWPHDGGYNAFADWSVPELHTALQYALELRVRAGTRQRLRTESFEIDVDAPPTASRR